ncbi:MAG: YitT family protein [Bacillota bacterium]
MKKFWAAAIDYIMIALGSALVALALNVLLVPNKVASGGVSAIGIVLFHLMHFPMSYSTLLLNIPLFLANIRLLGLKFGAKTAVGVLALSAVLEFTANWQPWTNNVLLASIYGGVIAGAGLGWVFRYGGTTGGTDLAANLVNRYLGVPMGTGLLVIDSLIMIVAVIVFGPELTMYGILAIFVQAKAIDLVQEGIETSRTLLIISDRSEEIGRTVMDRMERGVTALNATGLYTGQEKRVLMCAISRSELNKIKTIVHEVDPHAFVIVLNAHEVLGEGFKPRLV